MLIGRFRRTSGDDINILFDNFFNEIILPIRCKLIEAYSQITTKTSSFPQLTLHIKNQTQSGTRLSDDNKKQKFSFANVVYEAGESFSTRIEDRSLNVSGAQITFLFEII